MQTMTKKMMSAGVLAMACLATACGDASTERHPDGDLTGDLCLFGFREYTRMALVADGKIDLQVGRLRYLPREEDSLFGFHENERYACDVTDPPTVQSVEVGVRTGLTAHPTDEGFTLLTGHATQSAARVVTDEGDLDLDVFVHDVGRVWVSFHEKRAHAQDEVVLVSGGITPVLVSYEDADGLELQGEYVWRGMDGLPWVREDATLEWDEYSGHAPFNHRYHTVRAGDDVGFHSLDHIDVLDWRGEGIEVIAPEQVTSIELCWSDWCVVDGESFPSELFQGYHPPHDLGFYVVFKDAQGREALGVPADFSITYPEGWEDARHGAALRGQADWKLRATSDVMAPGVVEVTAYGKTTRVRIDPPTTEQIQAR